MKIYHLVDEITEKNQSIVSIIEQISKYKKWKFFKVVSHKRDETKNKNLKKVFFLKNFIKDYILYFSSLRQIIKNSPSTIVHIHGLWRPIYFFSLLFCKLNKIPFLIQPHGMLLEDALRSNTYFNYLLKIITLKIYNIFLNNVFFLAVTKEETDSINRYFKKPNIKIIENPFQFNRAGKEKISKKFIYFGRINKIKNIDLVIQAFIDSKPSKDWVLELYGIQDDQKYLNYLKSIINNSSISNQISLKAPVYGDDKYKIIKSAWCNVLISKSEILSLSVLESLSVGTPSIVNKNIYFPNWIKKIIFLSNIKTSNLKNSFRQIMDNKLYERKKMRKNIIKSFDKNYSTSKIKDKYLDYVNSISSRINTKKLIKQTPKFSKITQITAANSLNLFLLPFVVILYTFNGKSEISADVSIVSGSVLILCQVFSANARVILISNFKEKEFRDFMIFRVLLSIIFFICFHVAAYYFPNLQNYNNDLLILVILLSWLNELNLIYLEIKKMFKSLIFYMFLMLLIYILIFFSIFLDNTILTRDVLKYNSFFYILFFVYYFNFNEKLISKINLFQILENFKKLALLSSISNIIAVLIWRYSIYFTYDKKFAGIMIAAFSVASFPGTLVNNIVGPSFVKLKLGKKFLKNLKYILNLFLIILITTLLLEVTEKNLFYKLVHISLIGTIVLTFSIYLKNLLMVNNSLHKRVFKIDILYSLSIIPLIVILDYFNGFALTSYAYLVSGLISLLFYSTLFKKYEKYI